MAVVGLIDLLHRQLVFFPDRAVTRTPADLGLDFAEVYFNTDDGVRLHGWFIPGPAAAAHPAHPEPAATYSAHPELVEGPPGHSARPEPAAHSAHPELVEGPAATPSAHPEPAAAHSAHPELVAGQPNLTILWFHGNAGNLGYQVDDLAALRQWTAANIFIFDYRGYGNSAGRPSERGFYRDARAAWRYLLTRPDIDPQRIILYGRSLGTAAAVELAANPPDGPPPYAVILYSPLTSLGDMARAVHPWLPLHWLAGGQFNSLARIGGVSRPILIIHSAADEIIPVEQGYRLFAAAPEPKQFLSPDAAGHNDPLDLSDTALGQGLTAFLNSLPGY